MQWWMLVCASWVIDRLLMLSMHLIYRFLIHKKTHFKKNFDFQQFQCIIFFRSLLFFFEFPSELCSVVHLRLIILYALSTGYSVIKVESIISTVFDCVWLWLGPKRYDDYMYRNDDHSIDTMPNEALKDSGLPGTRVPIDQHRYPGFGEPKTTKTAADSFVTNTALPLPLETDPLLPRQAAE